MEIFFYLIIFIIGTLFGSFYTLAVYRIPKRQDIVHTHSYCPNCNHKLGLLDLFPIFSYILLGGKCRYCKQKIKPRYLILEMLSGALFVIMAYALKLSIFNLNKIAIIEFCFIVLYLTFVILISGIDKENRNMDKAVNIYGITISIIYMVYLCIVEKANIYRYGIYLILYIAILIFDTITLKKKAQSTYTSGILLSVITMIVFTSEYITGLSIVVALLAITIYVLIHKIKNITNKNKKTDKQITDNISFGFYIGFSNVLLFIMALLYNNYIL